jgi:hypothetical protein
MFDYILFLQETLFFCKLHNNTLLENNNMHYNNRNEYNLETLYDRTKQKVN